MSLINAFERPAGSWETDSKGVTHTLRRFILETTLDESETSVLNYCGIARGDSHPENPFCVAKSLKTTRWESDDNLGLFQTIVEYDDEPWDDTSNNSDPTKDPQESDTTKQPDLRPPTVKYSGVRVERVLEIDRKTTKPVLNCVFQKFDPGLIYNWAHRTITVEGWKSVSALDPDAHVATYFMSMNDKPFFFVNRSYKTNSLICTEDSWTYTWEHDAWWLKYSMVFEYNSDTWIYKVANLGTMELSDSGNIVPIMVPDPNNTGKFVRVTSPVPLDKNTQRKLAPTDPVQFLEFYGYDEADWTNIL